ncbi:3-phosphoshikimate 1-carboxyvinyltransferase [Jiulongibacter sp. NS-SX5]|uniref:3-phosphoshikimate 1-carboxyvinyltransferase n=1 Tax=Jiulongibacter sp. NS-SX5 TaxID=3463854 RepID=UPI0040581FBB
MDSILLKKNTETFQKQIPLASSKSESNRALIINALCGFDADLQNLASARDTQTMIRLLKEDSDVADVLDAGTTMRFLTAYFSAKGASKLMTGTPRMQERPIGILVDALRTIGVEIDYQKNDGYPPHQIKGFTKQKANQVSIRGDVSSQYISALLMIAPTLPDGLKISLTGEVGSIPYITMTINLMKSFGVDVNADWEKNVLEVAPQKYTPISYKIESDWSGASYWYSVVALAEHEDAQIELLGLKENSLQGDSAVVEIMEQLGVKSTFTEDGVLLTKIAPKDSLTWDFTNCPDLCQTIAVVNVMKRIPATYTGIESLKIKETDRVFALQEELQKLGGQLVEVEKDHKYEIRFTDIPEELPVIKTYEDHRMAMAFAPVAMMREVKIEEPEVVVKSYPEFWDHLSVVVPS